MVPRFSAEGIVSIVTDMAYEMMQLRTLAWEIGFQVDTPMGIFYESNDVILIANNPTFHEQIIFFEVDCYFIWNKFLQGLISAMYISTSE